MADLNVALILKLVDLATGQARAAVRAVQGIEDEATGKADRTDAKRTDAAVKRRQDALRRVGAAAGSTLGIGVSLREAISFESAMADVGKVLDFDRAGVDLLGRQILDLSTKIAVPAEDIAAIVEQAAQAGVVDPGLPDDEERRQLVEFAVDAARVSVAFGVSADDAGRAMAKWRNQLHLTQPEALHLADAINVLGNRTGAGSDATLQVLEAVGSLGDTAGLATNEIAALGAAFVEASPSPEIARTAFKNFTNTLTAGEAGTKRQTDAFTELGLSAVEMSERMQTDAEGAILSVLEALREVDAARRPGLVTSLFGEESQGAISPLLNNIDKVRRNFDLVRTDAATAGSVLSEYETRAATTAVSLQLTKNTFAELAITLGDGLLPVINSLAGALSPIVHLLADGAREAPALTAAILAMVGAFFALRLVTASHPVILVITTIIGAATLIYENWGGIAGFFGGIGDSIVANVTHRIEEVTAAVQALYDFVKGLFTELERPLRSGPNAYPKVPYAGVGEGEITYGGAVGNTSGSFARKRALGGAVRAGFDYAINEEGQEFFRPASDCTVIPARSSRGAAGADRRVSIGDIHVHAAPGMSAADVARAVRRELERLTAAAGNALHDGGAYAA